MKTEKFCSEQGDGGPYAPASLSPKPSPLLESPFWPHSSFSIDRLADPTHHLRATNGLQHAQDETRAQALKVNAHQLLMVDLINTQVVIISQ